MNNLVLILTLLNLSCMFSQDEVYIEKISSELSQDENRFDLDNIIYPINKRFLFSYSNLRDGIKVDSDLK